MCNVDLNQYVITDHGGYLVVEHFPSESDTEYGDHVCFLNAGDTFEDVLVKVRRHFEGVRE